MDNNYLKEKKLELNLEKLINQLIQDLNHLEEDNRVDASNYDYMKEVYISLANAEYYIISALSWSKGFKPKSGLGSKEGILKKFIEIIKK